ncbi:MAG: YihY family inner membrane protein, partial [Pseudomonadota bacterium]
MTGSADYSLKQGVAQLLELPNAVLSRYQNDRILRHAAALSFNSMLALAPMMALGFAVLSMFTSFEQIGTQLETFIYRYLVPAAGDELQAYLQQFAGQAGKLTLVGLVFFLLTALLLLFSVEDSFNDIFRVPKGRPMVARLTVYWALITLGPILMGASLTMSTYFLSISVFGEGEIVTQVRSFGLWVLPFVLETLAFFLLYLVMPHYQIRLRH